MVNFGQRWLEVFTVYKTSTETNKTVSRTNMVEKMVKDIGALKKKKVNTMKEAEFVEGIKAVFPDATLDMQKMKAEFESSAKLGLDFGLAIKRIRNHIQEGGKVNEKAPVIIFGCADQPSKNIDEDGNISFDEPFKVNAPTYFFETDTFGKLDVRGKTSYERLDIKWGQSCVANIIRQKSKDSRYPDFTWVANCTEHKKVSKADLEAILKRHMVFPEFIRDDNITGYPTMVLYGSLGSFTLQSKEFKSEDKFLALEKSKDKQAENPCFMFTLYNRKISDDGNFVCFTHMRPQWFGRFNFEINDGNAMEFFKKVSEQYGKQPVEMQAELNNTLGGGLVNVFVIGTPQKLVDKEGKLQLTFNAVSVIETDYVPEKFPDYEEFWTNYKNRVASKPTPSVSSGSVSSTSEDLEKKKKALENAKVQIQKGLDVLGEKADFESLKNGGFLNEISTMPEETVKRLIEKMRKKEEPKKDEEKKTEKKEETKETPKEAPKETPKESPKEEKSSEAPKDVPKEAPKETPKETSTEAPKEAPKVADAPKEEPKKEKETPDETDVEIAVYYEKIEKLGLGDQSKKIFKFIYSNDDGKGIEVAKISSSVDVKPAMLTKALKRLVTEKLLYSPSENMYSVNL